jgi:8-oxo-dGTP pyrophosphatase MutT (NUDIX family)
MSDPFDTRGANPWQTRSSTVLYERGNVRLLEDDVLQPDGSAGHYVFVQVKTPVVAIVPLSEDGFVHMVRQWRYPWQRNSWEIPAGHCEDGEEPLRAARRELAEEAGLEAADWAPLGTGFGSAAMNVRYHMYLARGLSPVATPHQRDAAEEDLITQRIPVDAAIRAAMDGTIVHVFSVVGLLRAARHLGI